MKAASVVSLQHHEKWDGTGYPYGVAGEEIHIFARITALGDVFDALASNREYKKAWDMDKILELIKEESGRHFDPNIVDIFFKNIDDIIEIKNRYRD